jgi:hypothetical protein
MERLTYWCDNGHGGGKWFVAIDAEGEEDYGPHVDRLAAYEETGLEPGEIEQLKGEAFGLRVDKQELEQYRALGPIDRLRELVKADREGRCVVPPCKVGQKVKVDVRTWGNVWNYKTVENGKFLIGEIVAITKTKKQTLVKIRVEHNVSWKRPTRRYPASAIGKTVFLTRGEAEAALRREQDG